MESIKYLHLENIVKDKILKKKGAMNGIKRGECNVSAKQTPTSFPDYSTKSWTEKEKNFQRDFPVNCKNLAE